MKKAIQVECQHGHKHGKGKKNQICKKDIFQVTLACSLRTLMSCMTVNAMLTGLRSDSFPIAKEKLSQTK